VLDAPTWTRFISHRYYRTRCRGAKYRLTGVVTDEKLLLQKIRAYRFVLAARKAVL
jgi:hypothetical protein